MCPLVALSGDVLLKAALGTAAIVGSMSAIAASAPSDSFLKMGTGLGIGFFSLVRY